MFRSSSVPVVYDHPSKETRARNLHQFFCSFLSVEMIEVTSSVLISKVTTANASDSVTAGFERCWGFLPRLKSNNVKVKKTEEVLVLNPSSLLLLESRDGSTKFRVRRKVLLHQVDVDRGDEPGTIVIRRAGEVSAGEKSRGDGSGLTVRFQVHQDAESVYTRTLNARTKFQAALDLLAIPGAEVSQRLAPRLIAVVVNNTIVARRHPTENEEISIKAVSGKSTVEFVAESPMGIVSARVHAKELIAPTSTPYKMHLFSVQGDDDDDEYDGEDARRVGVELAVETSVSRWRVGLILAAAAALVFFAFAVYEALRRDGTAAFVLLAAMLAVRVAVAATRYDLSVKVSSCSVVEQQPKSSTISLVDTPYDNAPSFSRCLSVEHCISLRRSLVDGLDLTTDELESSLRQDVLARLHGISPAVNNDLFQRYIAACKGDVSNALTRLEATAHWRQANGVDKMLDGADLPYFFIFKKHYLHCLLGRTKDGLPILVGTANASLTCSPTCAPAHLLTCSLAHIFARGHGPLWKSCHGVP
jgi:hypothetical protein